MFVVMMLCLFLTACNQPEDEIVSSGFTFQANSKEMSDARLACEIKSVVSFQNDIMIRLYFGHGDHIKPSNIPEYDELLEITAQNGDFKEVLFTSNDFFYNNEYTYNWIIKNGKRIITFNNYIDFIIPKKLFIDTEGTIRFSIVRYYYEDDNTSTDGHTIKLNYKMIRDNDIKFCF